MLVFGVSETGLVTAHFTWYPCTRTMHGCSTVSVLLNLIVSALLPHLTSMTCFIIDPCFNFLLPVLLSNPWNLLFSFSSGPLMMRWICLRLFPFIFNSCPSFPEHLLHLCNYISCTLTLTDCSSCCGCVVASGGFGQSWQQTAMDRFCLKQLLCHKMLCRSTGNSEKGRGWEMCAAADCGLLNQRAVIAVSRVVTYCLGWAPVL